MDWFERITGFAERGYADTRARLHVADGHLVSDANGIRHGIGTFDLPSLASLRAGTKAGASSQRSRVVAGVNYLDRSTTTILAGRGGVC